MSTDSNSPAAVAQAYTSNPRFHQNFTLEATDTHDTLNVTYAEVGQEPDETNSTPTVLLMPGMFASRYLGLPLHAIAATKGVRMVVVDRYDYVLCFILTRNYAQSCTTRFPSRAGSALYEKEISAKPS